MSPPLAACETGGHMTHLNSTQDLGERIEQLVQEHISATRLAAQAAVERAFSAHTAARGRASQGRSSRTAATATGRRRASAEVAALAERLYDAVARRPGETMAALAPIVGSSARELNRPMRLLKRAGRLRSVGQKHATRYFPLAGGTSPAS